MIGLCIGECMNEVDEFNDGCDSLMQSDVEMNNLDCEQSQIEHPITASQEEGEETFSFDKVLQMIVFPFFF